MHNYDGYEYMDRIYGDFKTVSINELETIKRRTPTFNCVCTTCGYKSIKTKTMLVNTKENIKRYLTCPECKKMAEINAFIGQVFGDYKIIGYNKERSEREKRIFFVCQCTKCNTTLDKSKTELINNKHDKCPACKKRIEDAKRQEEIDSIMNHTFGDFKVIGIDNEASKKNHTTTFICQCTNCERTMLKIISRFRNNSEGFRCTACKGKAMGDDITGNIYEDFKVIEYSPERSKTAKIQMFKCECTNCGHIVYRTRTELTTKTNTKCQKCHNDFGILLTDVKDMIGKTFGDFTVIRGNSEASKKKNRCIVVCKCNKCNREFNKARADLLHGVATRCKCNGSVLRDDPENFVNKRFGDLYVLSYNEEESKKQKKSIYTCKCLKCGSIKNYLSSNLKCGISKSCGCSRSGYDSKHTIPMLNKTFGDLTVIEVDQEAIDEHIGKDYIYKCRCPKGHISRHRGVKLRSLQAECPLCKQHSNSKFEDLTGQTFGRLKVIKKSAVANDGQILWECECTRPGESKPHGTKIASTHALKSGYITSCGCESDDKKEEKRKYDPDIKSQLKTRFKLLKERCDNPNNGYYDTYGGRGITYEFDSYDDFYDECAEDYKKAKEMYPGIKLDTDRIDNDGNYAPGNIRFVPQQINNINKSNTVFYRVSNNLWTSAMLSEYAKRNGNNISPQEIERRLNNGWGVENAVFNPTDDKNARYIRKPIYDMKEVEMIHKTSQGLHPDDTDYFFNDTPNEVLACDYSRMVKENLEKKNKDKKEGNNNDSI